MARFTLESKDVMIRLDSLAKKLADAIAWVRAHPQKINIEIPDELWGLPTKKGHFGDDCDTPIRVYPSCTPKGLPEERADLEILIGVLKKKG